MTFRYLISESWRAVRGNGEVFLLLVALQAAVNTLIFKLSDIDLSGFETVNPQDSQAVAALLAPLLPTLFWSAVVTIAFHAAISAVWCRVVGAGRDQVFRDGFAIRFLLVAWRYLGMIGYILLLIFAFAIFSIPVAAFARLLGDSLGALLSMLVSGLLFVGFLAIFLALMLSIASTSLDPKGKGLAACAQSLGAGWRPFLLAGLVLMASYIAVSLTMAGPIAENLASGGGIDLPLPVLILSSAFGAAINLALLTLGVAAWMSAIGRGSE